MTSLKDVTSLHPSFEEWVDWLFDDKRPGPRLDVDVLSPFHPRYDFRSPQVADKATDYIIRLFTGIGDIGSKYRFEAVERGLSAFIEIQDWLDILMLQDLSASRRAQLFQSMYHLYSDWALPHAYSTGPPNRRSACALDLSMLWDVIVYEARRDDRPDDVTEVYRALSEWVQELNESILQVLRRILTLDDKYCQEAALWGLNTLCHPKSEETVRSHIAAHRDRLAEWGILDDAIKCAEAKMWKDGPTDSREC